MTERARILFRQSVQTVCMNARNARGVFRPRAFRACTRAPPKTTEEKTARPPYRAHAKRLGQGNGVGGRFVRRRALRDRVAAKNLHPPNRIALISLRGAE
jgi:hypothetical protein